MGHEVEVPYADCYGGWLSLLLYAGPLRDLLTQHLDAGDRGRDPATRDTGALYTDIFADLVHHAAGRRRGG